MAVPTKPYRRYRSRGGGDGDLDALRALNTREQAEAAPKPKRDPKADIRIAGAPRGRRWWSLRGIGVWGWTWRLGLIALAAVAVWAGLGFWEIRSAVEHSNAMITPAARRALDTPPGGLLGTPTNTLIIGADGRRGETRSRADSIMIMRTDPGGGDVKWLSIPRDVRVEIPGQGTQKINASYFFGGQAGVIRAVRSVTGLPIHHLVVVNFRGFPKLVDELGGVTVRNPTAIVNCPYPGGRTVSFRRGDIELSGTRALEFVRVRKCDDDFRRAARQQAFVNALRGKVVSPTSLPWAPWRGAAAIRTVATDLGTMDMLKLGWLQVRLDSKPGNRTVLAGIPRYENGVAYVIVEPDVAERQIARFVRRN
jgi:LCP family protein required for cell wall assembly